MRLRKFFAWSVLAITLASIAANANAQSMDELYLEAKKEGALSLNGALGLSLPPSLLAWYVFAPQCLSTLVTARRETNSWRYPLIMAGYLFAMAWVASFATYRIAIAFTGGIGEHSASMRHRICDGLGFLGLRLDDDLNEAADGRAAMRISKDSGAVQNF